MPSTRTTTLTPSAGTTALAFGFPVWEASGLIVTDAETTITPQIALSGATGGGVSVNAPSFMRFTYDGPAGRESVGSVA